MKILTPQKTNSSFSGIKTVVFYKWSSFIPTNSEKITDRDKELLIESHGSSEFYYSGGNSSDFLTFSEYDFKLNPEKEDLKGFVKSNYFDSVTLKEAKDENNKYNQEILINFEDYLLPQLSVEEFSSDSNKKFFGSLTNESYNVIYLDIPGNENGSPIWMVELYDDYLETNHSISSKRKNNPFISYKLLELISPNKIISKPNNIIIFGPEPNYINNFGENQSDYSFYYKGNLDYYNIESSDYIKISEDSWLSLCREITSRKILKIVISPEGFLNKVLNLSRFAWDVSKNPNRNKNKYSLRNDEFWATRDFYKLETDSPILKDKRSGSIISTRKVEAYESLPILNSKLSRLGKRFSPNKVYKESETVLINDYIYSSLISGNLGENPVYSNYWKVTKYFEPGDEDVYINNYQESLSLLRNDLSSDYYQAYIHVNNKFSGKVSPSGQQYFRKGSKQEILITPNPGVDISDIIVSRDGKRISSQKPRLVYSKEKQSYVYPFPDDTIINSLIDVKVLFSSKQLGIIPDSLRGFEDSNINILTFSEITEKTGTVNSEHGIVITFKDSDENLISPVQTKVKTESGEEKLRDLLEFSKDTKFPVRMYVLDEDSHYSFIGISDSEENNNSLREFNTLIDEKTGKKYVQFDESIGLKAVFEIQKKKLNCRIIPDSGIEVSSVGSYVDYSNGYKFSFATLNEYFNLSIIKFTFNSYSETISDVGPFCFKDENNNTILEGDLTFDELLGIYTLSINQVLFSIDINIESILKTSHENK